MIRGLRDTYNKIVNKYNSIEEKHIRAKSKLLNDDYDYIYKEQLPTQKDLVLKVDFSDEKQLYCELTFPSISLLGDTTGVGNICRTLSGIENSAKYTFGEDNYNYKVVKVIGSLVIKHITVVTSKYLVGFVDEDIVFMFKLYDYDFKLTSVGYDDSSQTIDFEFTLDSKPKLFLMLSVLDYSYSLKVKEVYGELILKI